MSAGARAYAPVGALVVLAALGALMALGMVTAGAGARLGTGHRTSFGSLTVLAVEVHGAVGEHDLGGMAHGVQGLVPEGKVDVQVTVRLTNASQQTVAYAPTMFRLRPAAGGEPVPASTGTLLTGELFSGSSIDARMSFVAAAGASVADDRGVLELDDHGSAVRVRLGHQEAKAASGPQDNQDTHDDHDDHEPSPG